MNDSHPSWMPERVRIGPLWFTVKAVPEPISRDVHGNDDRRGHRLWGCINHTPQEIEINSTSAPDRQFSILLHEAIHAIENDRGIELKEEQVMQVANGISAFLLDNGFVRLKDE